ncbi:hypothetical protein Mnod_8154 (plasmid) [Methylobacterium nodulans ORS 2060]|uniref:Uncharacterized protein n=1 Tax=Methylobacterium nodulans (strain LMG 21967 / CNCM I-2342 / ORS 2060) TaxID=460265 RepID=B8IX92_METNO|nr:hypothetical protein Mnod_8154 [Methylobacterium nodulans ORS 2060]
MAADQITQIEEHIARDEQCLTQLQVVIARQHAWGSTP